jgi:uncharacterized protein
MEKIMRTWLRISSFVAAAAFIFYPLALFAAAIDCTKASSPREKLACANPQLLALDKQMDEACSKALDALSDVGRKILAEGQNDWIQFIDKVIPAVEKNDADDLESRISGAYRTRIEELRDAAFQKGPYLFSRVDLFSAERQEDEPWGYWPGFRSREISYPRIDRPVTPATEEWNRQMAKYADPSQFEEDPGNVALSFRINSVSSRLVSILFTYFWYYPGAAHGNLTPWNSTILLSDRLRELKPEDLFDSGEARDRRAPVEEAGKENATVPGQPSQDVAQSREQQPGSIGTQTPKETWSEFLARRCADELNRISEEEGFGEIEVKNVAGIVTDVKNWSITDSGLMISFAPYSVSCYAFGSRTVTIPWPELKGFLVQDPPVP